MKSVTFLRNTWKKWEHKTSDGRDKDEMTTRDRSIPAHLQTSAASGRSLNVAVKHQPLEISAVEAVEGSWQPSDRYQPPSPAYDRSPQKRGEHTLIHRDSSRSALDLTYSAHAAHLPRSARDSPTPPTPTTPLKPSSSSSPLRPSNAAPPLWIHRRDSRPAPADSRHQSLARQTPPPSPRSPTLPSYQLLPPIDLNYGPGSRFESDLEAKLCKCTVRPGKQSRHHAQCPKYTISDAYNNKAAPAKSGAVKPSQKTVHAVLDLSVNSKPRSLYHLSASSPHLPIKDRNLRQAPSAPYSAGGSDADHFPLSLFPAPPPLIIRKKVPAPLVLRSTDPSYSQSSSVDSTPAGTPTTPRFQSVNSPSHSSITSPNKKSFTLRPCTSFSPPPFSPPNSPLPNVPVSPLEGVRRSADHRGASPDRDVRPLRVAQSSANLRGALPFPPTHRLTTSEPISDQSSLPASQSQQRSPVKPRPETMRAKHQIYTEFKDQPMSSTSAASSENHVQWGYAL